MTLREFILKESCAECEKPAKDFDGEKPEDSGEEPEAKNIFDYAVQKAKRLQGLRGNAKRRL